MATKIGIVNGGGDCAGLNAVVESVVKAGIDEGYEFTGIVGSFEGLLGEGEVMELNLKNVDGISRLGGTILRTTNKGRFSAKVGAGEVQQIPSEIIDEAISKVNELGLEALVVIGGDGTLTAALQIQQRGVNLVGVPKTIDNDLSSTDMTFGFSSAVDFVADALDRVHTTAESHNRVILVETMGRYTGWIALHGGIAGSAHAILIPEFEFGYDDLVSFLRKRRENGYNYSIVVVAEGAKALGEDISIIQNEGQKKEHQLGGISQKIMEKIVNLSGEEFELRNVVLGHLQRGGSPNSFDRILAQRYGVAAMKAIKEKNYGKMLCLRGNEITAAPIAEAVAQLNRVTEQAQIFETAKELGIFFGKY